MKEIRLPKSEKKIKEIINAIDKNGFVSIDKAISPSLLDELIDEIERISQEKKKYFSIIDLWSNKNSAFNQFKTSTSLTFFIDKLASIYFSSFLTGQRLKETLEDKNNANVLRVISGVNSSMRFHYDRTLITILIPIIIPKKNIEDSGHLITINNFRKVRKYSITSLLDKLLIQNRISQKMISFLNFNESQIKIMTPGNIYIFNGYRTIHGNYPVSDDALRATFLIHIGDPHKNSKILKFFTEIVTSLGKIRGEKIFTKPN